MGLLPDFTAAIERAEAEYRLARYDPGSAGQRDALYALIAHSRALEAALTEPVVGILARMGDGPAFPPVALYDQEPVDPQPVDPQLRAEASLRARAAAETDPTKLRELRRKAERLPAGMGRGFLLNEINAKIASIDDPED